MDYVVNLNVKSRKCVIIGGGNAAALKAERLMAAGAQVHIIAPVICSKCRKLGAVISKREYAAGDTEGAFIVFALTDDDELNCRIETDARKSGTLIGGDDFSVAAAYSGRNLTVAVNTRYPKLSAKLAADIMKYDTAAGILSEYRKSVSEYTDDKSTRDALLTEAVTDEMLAAALSDPDKFRRILADMLI